MPAVASRELRNNTRAPLDRVDAGEDITITVDGRAFAELRPLLRRHHWMNRSEFVRELTQNQTGPELASVSVKNTSFDITAQLRIPKSGSGGVVICQGGTASLSVDGAVVARERVEATVPFVFSMSGETLDVGVDTGSPVGPYPNHFPFQGEIERVVIDLRSDLAEEDINSQKEGQDHAARAIQ